MHIVNHPAYPAKDAVQHGAWLKLFTAELPALAARYGLTEPELAEAQQLASLYRTWLIDQLAAREAQPEVGALVLTQLRKLVERLCQHPAFSQADAQLLRLQRAPWNGGLHRLPVPRFSALLYPGQQVVLLWRRRRATHLDIQVCRDGTNWHTLPGNYAKTGRLGDLIPHSVLPAIWHYRGRYREADGTIGAWSDMLYVNVQPVAAGEAAGPISFPRTY